MDYRKMYDDKDHLYAYDLDDYPGREVTLEIRHVAAGELTGEKGRKTKKPMVTFVGIEKKLAINKTNGKAISRLYGKDTDEWIGEIVTLYATTTEMDGETKDCIRIRPQRPNRSQLQGAAAGGGGGRGGRGGGGGRGDDRQRAAAEQSAIAAKYLIEQYAVIAVGRPGTAADGERMAELKTERAKVWEQLGTSDREAVGAAAKAAKARIDGEPAATPPPAGVAPPAAVPSDAAAPPDEDEAAAIRRADAEAAARG